MPRLNTLVCAGLLLALSGAHLAQAQTDNTNLVTQLTVQSGNGQVACACLTSTLQTVQPISVKATGTNGPVNNATVTWKVLSGPLFLGTAGTTTAQSVTNSAGVSSIQISVYYTNNFASFFTPDLVGTIQAQSNGQTVVFTETQSLLTATGASEVVAGLPTFGGGALSQATVSGNVGTTLGTPILVQVAGADEAGVGGSVAVRIINSQLSPTLTCDPSHAGAYADPGSVLTIPQGTSQGLASCYPMFNGSGTGTFYITVGGLPATSIGSALYLQEFGPFTFSSIPGAAAAIDIVSGNNQVGQSGLQLNPLVAEVVDANGYAVQNANVVWSLGTPIGTATVTNIQTVTDNNGQVSATVAVYAAAASGALITVTLQSNPNISASFQETLAGALTSLNKISGDTQRGQTGANFPQPLVLQLNSASGPVKNYPLQFITNGPVSLPVGSTVFTDANGEVSIAVRAGPGTGTATVTAIAGLLNQTFNLTVTTTANSPAPTSITKVGNDPAPVVIDTSFATSLVVQVNSSLGPLGGVVVSFSTSSPIVVISSSTATTDNSSGQAQITVQAGASPGTATVTASISGLPAVVFNLTVLPPGPALTANSFLNAASRQVGAISPCSLATISAAGLTPDGTSDLSPAPFFGRLPLSVHNLSVTFNNLAAPIVDVAAGSANPEVTVEVPCELAPGNSVPVTVNVGLGHASINTAVQAVSPGIFETLMSDGTKRAVVVRDDGSFVDIGGAVANPARRGENVRIYVTGLGATIPALATNTLLNPEADLQDLAAVANVAGTVTVGIVGAPGVQVLSARPAPNLIGIYEIKFVLPGSAPTGNNVLLSVGIIPQGNSLSSTPIYALNSMIPIQ